MLLVYTGPGKGKTSAALGQVLRALGRGLSVAFGQFMKAPEQAGEQVALAELLGANFYAGGLGFYLDEKKFPEHREAAQKTLAWAGERLEQGADVLVLDEAVYALGYGLVLEEELRDLIDRAQARGCHLVLTGRGAPDWLVARADTVSSIEATKHAYDAGGKAVPGVDY